MNNYATTGDFQYFTLMKLRQQALPESEDGYYDDGKRFSILHINERGTPCGDGEE
jgi:hypothetical protein